MDYLLKNNNTSLTRTFAILLIINSHLDTLYENSLLASGGAIGNTLFFLISGYGLKFSFDRNKQVFFEWIQKRLIAIYPAVWIVNILTFIFLNSTKELSSKFFLSFFYTDYWFINAIILYYILSYFFLNLKKKKKFLIFYLLVIAIYFVIYSTLFNISNDYITEDFPEKIFFYFITFLGGILLFHFKDFFKKYYKYYSLLWLICFLSYITIKIKFRNSIFFLELQIIQQILQLFLALGIILFNFYFYKKIKINKLINYPIIIVSNITLEIYLIHGVVVHYFSDTTFSVSLKVLYIYIFSISAATLLKIISRKISLVIKK